MRGVRRADRHSGGHDTSGTNVSSARTDTVLSDETAKQVVASVLAQIENLGWTVRGSFTSPIRGQAGNLEVFAHLTRVSA